MKQKKTYMQLALRLMGATAALGLLLALPVDWGRVGRTAAMLAVGMERPGPAAALLGDRLFPDAGTSPEPSRPAGTGAATPWDPNLGGDPLPEPGLPNLTPATPPITAISPPGEKGNGGKIDQQIMDTGDRNKAGIATINRSGTAVDISGALKRTLSLSWADTDQPQVLILHTHTTEGYMTYDAGYYNKGDRDRTTDHTRNVCAVGEAIRLTLAQAGITAIHDTTVHDAPVYSGAYNRSAATAKTYLEAHPTIQVVLDIHRDAVMAGDTTLVKPTATVAGRKAAQMMLITGVVSTEGLPHPHWEDNLTFSTQLQQALDRVSPDLMRPLNTVASRYNQQLSPGWVLVEVGSEGNTVEESVYAGQLLAHTLANLLKGTE